MHSFNEANAENKTNEVDGRKERRRGRVSDIKHIKTEKEDDENIRATTGRTYVPHKIKTKQLTRT